MGYNFWGGWSNTSGPCAPLIGGSINMANVILEEYGEVTENNPEKLILGVPYYGNKWKTQDEWAYSNVLDHINQPTFSIAMTQAEQNTLLWDDLSETSWSLNNDNNQYLQTWFDTDSSVGMKYDLAQNYALKGVGMWALGYDGSRTELWNELRKRFGEPIFITDNNIVNNNITINIFPNPFRDLSSIELFLKKDSDISVNIYDNQGNMISVVMHNQNLCKGKHRIELDMGNSKPGMYYCCISYWDDSQQTILRKKFSKL